MKKKSCRIIISEPWDFQNSEGSNIISGHIVSILNENYAIFKSDKMQLLNGFRWNYFLLSPRLSHEFFCNGIKSIYVNGAGLSLLNDKQLIDINSIKHAQFLFIGDLKST